MFILRISNHLSLQKKTLPFSHTSTHGPVLGRFFVLPSVFIHAYTGIHSIHEAVIVVHPRRFSPSLGSDMSSPPPAKRARITDPRKARGVMLCCRVHFGYEGASGERFSYRWYFYSVSSIQTHTKYIHPEVFHFEPGNSIGVVKELPFVYKTIANALCCVYYTPFHEYHAG